MSAAGDGLLDGYQVPEGCQDELVGADGMPLACAATRAGENHVKIGGGRHYSDVPPIKASIAAPPRPRSRRA